jgi:capsid protein
MRDYQAAMVNNLTASWTTVNQTAAQIVYKNLNTLRARSREQVQNNDYAKFFMTLLKTNVVGPNGFNFQARALDPKGTPDKGANDAIDLAFRDWMRPKHADPRSQLSFIEQQRLFISSVATDGEVLCRIRRGKKYGKYGFAIEFIDPGYLDVNFNDTDHKTRNNIEMGIEYDSDDMPVAYHVITTQRLPVRPGEPTQGLAVDGRCPAPVEHAGWVRRGCVGERPGRRRKNGVPRGNIGSWQCFRQGYGNWRVYRSI